MCLQHEADGPMHVPEVIWTHAACEYGHMQHCTSQSAMPKLRGVLGWGSLYTHPQHDPYQQTVQRLVCMHAHALNPGKRSGLLHPCRNNHLGSA